ncbi:hypothetical protein [Ornithinimicrobium kibberense]|uniref:hypothetical protein n=1 Tax=Ornithinimicrobium kibberense TaxID=282060 RepID=UPI0036122306
MCRWGLLVCWVRGGAGEGVLPLDHRRGWGTWTQDRRGPAPGRGSRGWPRRCGP